MTVNKELIGHLLPLDESGWLDFKRDMYAVFDKQAKNHEWQRNELTRDIISLANGNTQSVGKTAYLIIGAANARNSDNSRDLFDVDKFELSKKQIMDWVNAFAEPPVEEIYPHFITYQDKRLFVIEVPPSRYVHKITRPLQTDKVTIYHKNYAFLRMGEDIHHADDAQVATLRAAKQSHFAYSKNVNPLWFGPVLGAIALGSINWVGFLSLIPEGQNLIEIFGVLTINVTFRFIAAVTGAALGGAFGYAVQRMKLLHPVWIIATKKQKIQMVLFFIVLTALLLLVVSLING